MKMKKWLYLAALLLFVPVFNVQGDRYTESTAAGGVISANTCTTDNALIVNDGTDGTALQCSVDVTHDGKFTLSKTDWGTGIALEILEGAATLMSFEPDNASVGAIWRFNETAGAARLFLTLSSSIGEARFDGSNSSTNFLFTPVAKSEFLLDVILQSGVLTLKETTTPTPLADHGKIYFKTDNALYAQDGAGAEHLVTGEAFGNLWFHAATPDVVTIGTEDAFIQIDSFITVGEQDSLSNVVGSASTNDFTIGANAAGMYDIHFDASISVAGGATKELILVSGVTLATPLDITDVTDNTISPIVITSTAHSLENGDMVEIVGVLVNTAANGSFIVDNKTANTFEIVALDGTATTGNGDYDEGTPTGDIAIVYGGCLLSHVEASQAELRSSSAGGYMVLAASDTVEIYVANLDDTSNLNVAAISFEVERISN